MPIGDTDPDTWRLVLDHGLGCVDSQGLIDYEKLLSRFHVVWALGTATANAADDAVAERSAMQHLMAATLRAELTLQETMALFDKNLSDTMDVAECRQMLTQLLPGLSRRQMHHIVETLRVSWGGFETVRTDRFLVAFCVEYPASRPPGVSETPQWLLDSLLQLHDSGIGGFSSKHRLGQKLLETFREWDEDGDGLLRTQELMGLVDSDTDRDISILKLLGVDDERRLKEFVEYLDMNGSGKVSIFEFLQGIMASTPASTKPEAEATSMEYDSRTFPYNLSDDVRSAFLAVLRTHRPTVLRGCRALDIHNRGTLGRLEFMEVVKALLLVLREQGGLHPNLTRPGMPAIDYLGDRLPTQVEYVELLDSLQIVERGQQPVVV